MCSISFLVLAFTFFAFSVWFVLLEVVAALMDPISFATLALQTLAVGTEDSDEVSE